MSETTETITEPATGDHIKLDIQDILRILPHRYPFLLIDRVVDLTRRQRVVAIKNVTFNEPFFQGHFPGVPIMPGVLIIEAIAQAGGALLLTEIPDRENKLMVFTGIERARFRRPVVPGDQLRIEVEVKAWREGGGRNAVRMEGIAYVDSKKVAEAIVTCQLVPKAAGTGTSSTAGAAPEE
jgi:3-hydroxyacyl-[acyl-carrier-protein] dehydratase